MYERVFMDIRRTYGAHMEMHSNVNLVNLNRYRNNNCI